ncbi:histidine phosphatase family protein [Marihabitans asiaticum]|uniref:Putative phosphoglycerate mutase n=1 Tax=Marihabitans asiaticum TaxID=415218 RepID=A0A560W9W7_9MICO|nr:histidine phosphatase family protein [Marihabitans asiaticum]TWD14426.1 putative phosphoglycerate mutase [Marihabitans asiaticum]
MSGATAQMTGLAAPRRLVVLRHGETDSNAKGIWQGQLDHELSERGHAQAKAAARALIPLRPSRVLSSDLRRAQVTGQDVATACGVELSTDERLREIHAGGWQGLTGTQVRERYPEDAERLLTGEDFRRGGTGETIAEVAQRARSLVDEVIASMEPGECVVLATHGVTARSLVCDLVGLDQQQSWLAIGGLRNCHWALLEEGRAGWRIAQWNVGPAQALATDGATA